MIGCRRVNVPSCLQRFGFGWEICWNISGVREAEEDAEEAGMDVGNRRYVRRSSTVAWYACWVLCSNCIIFVTFSNDMSYTFVIIAEFFLALGSKVDEFLTVIALNLTHIPPWFLPLGTYATSIGPSEAFCASASCVSSHRSSCRRSLRQVSNVSEGTCPIRREQTFSTSGCNFIKIDLFDLSYECLEQQIKMQVEH